MYGDKYMMNTKTSPWNNWFS